MAAGLRSYLTATGLAFAAFDLVRTTAGEHYFLEANANGEWGWLTYVVDLPIAEALADLLLGGKPSYRPPHLDPTRPTPTSRTRAHRDSRRATSVVRAPRQRLDPPLDLTTHDEPGAGGVVNLRILTAITSRRAPASTRKPGPPRHSPPPPRPKSDQPRIQRAQRGKRGANNPAGPAECRTPRVGRRCRAGNRCAPESQSRHDDCPQLRSQSLALDRCGRPARD